MHQRPWTASRSRSANVFGVGRVIVTSLVGGRRLVFCCSRQPSSVWLAVRGVGPASTGQRPGFIYGLLLRGTFSSASFRHCECSFRLQPVRQGAPDLLAFRDTVALFDPFEARGQFRIQQKTMQPLCHGREVYIDLYRSTREHAAKGNAEGGSNHRDCRSAVSCLRGRG